MADVDVELEIDDDGETEGEGTANLKSGETDAKDSGPKGGENAVLADLARERKKRQAATAEVAELRKFKEAIEKANGKDTSADQPTEREQAWESTAVKLAARASFREAGFAGDKGGMAKLVRMIDTDDIEFDPETGEVDGIDEQVADLKKSFPGLFADPEPEGKKVTAPRIKRGQGEAAVKEKSSTERLAERLLGH